MYIRFTVERKDERSGSAEGWFTVASRELGSGVMADYEREWLEAFSRRIEPNNLVLSCTRMDIRSQQNHSAKVGDTSVGLSRKESTTRGKSTIITAGSDARGGTPLAFSRPRSLIEKASDKVLWVEKDFFIGVIHRG